MSNAARRRQLSRLQVSRSIAFRLCLSRIGKFLGLQCFFFRKEARVVRVCALAVTPSDRRRGVARSDVFPNAPLRPPSVRCFLFASSLQNLPTSRLLIRSSVRQRRDTLLVACHSSSPGRRHPFSLFFCSWSPHSVTGLSPIRSFLLLLLAAGRLHLGPAILSSRFSPFPLLCFSRLVVPSLTDLLKLSFN